ncbi:Mu transposase C-terminal domain-containing protein [Psychroflexus sp. ALD_RP9]|uniref:Mu transposase C-terminal domain-containing protein n=1 Tax=Psychroflexus sp. ALD_RP9 TaxID=2777186 RepID=UPI001A8FE24C|nr:Mu transposase C-terminal domain-containing protein [Psychroflexus sp. ALD_RP9]QSS96618.1 Mu transposase C-terminal domain-containing protein [Psychroflexus sp. ALD_RP9]
MILNTCHEITTNVVTCRKFGGKIRAWKEIAKAVSNLPDHTYKHKLPSNWRRLKSKYNQYKKEGYESLIHGNFLNTSAQKLNGDACKWALARWSNQVNKCANLAQLHAEYNKEADKQGWKHIKEEKTFYNFIYDEEVMPLWYGHRYGELAAKEKFGYQFKTKMPAFRDSLWFSDGTKLNYFYLNEDGEVKTVQVYEVMDAYSEVFLGYHISKTEDYQAQYSAYKMAIQTAGYRPYQIKYDNQGGHGKLKSGDFLSKIARIQTATQPYNGKSKTIESAFSRFQQQYLKRDWFFTGQNITAKKQESKANMEFILANKANLPSLEDIKKVYEARRKEWNSAPHHKTGKPRIDMYLESQNPDTKAVEIWDMVNMFWVTRKKPITVNASGLSFKEQKAEYHYMVYTEDGMPDLNWLKKSIGKKFVVKFDPEDMSEIRLFEDTNLGLRFVTAATTKLEVSRGMQGQEEFEASHIKKVTDQVKKVRRSARDEMEDILFEHGMTAEQQGLNKPNLKGIERSKKGRKKKAQGEIGQYTKAISNQDWDDEVDLNQEVEVNLSEKIV